MRTKSNTSIDVYQIVTDKIIEKLSQGVIPWKQGYTTEAARNYCTGKTYRGINALLLSMTDHRHPYFMTYKQAQALGGHVRKGAKSEIAVYYQMRYYDPSRKKWLSASKDTTLPASCKVIPLLKYYRMFGIEDIEDIDFVLPNEPY